MDREQSKLKFRYLGCYFTQNLDPEMEVKRICGYARNNFKKLKKLVTG